MMFEIQILDGSVANYNSKLMRMVVSDGEWLSLRPAVPETAPPFRYEDRCDAHLALEKLFPDLEPEQRRVVKV